MRLIRTFTSAAMAALLSVSTITMVHAEEPEILTMMAIVEITCEGNRNVCYEYEENGATIQIGGDLVEIIIENSRACGGGEVSVRNIFLHSSVDRGTGKGYIGASACVDPLQRRGIVIVDQGAAVYNTYAEWRTALSAGTGDN